MAEYLEKSAVIKAIHNEIYSGGKWSGGWYEKSEEQAEKDFTKRINAITPVTKAEIIQALEDVRAEIHKLAPERGMWEIDGDKVKEAVIETLIDVDAIIDRKIKEIKNE